MSASTDSAERRDSGDNTAAPSSGSGADSIELAQLRKTASSSGSEDLEKQNSSGDKEKRELGRAESEEAVEEDKRPKLVYVPFVGRKVPREPYASLDDAPIIPLANVRTVAALITLEPLQGSDTDLVVRHRSGPSGHIPGLHRYS